MLIKRKGATTIAQEVEQNLKNKPRTLLLLFNRPSSVFLILLCIFCLVYDQLITFVDHSSSIVDSVSLTTNAITVNDYNNNITSNMKIAICHKTLFGDINLKQVIMWSKYHYNLGFNKIFIWYNPNIKKNKYFNELKNLTYVKMMSLRVNNQPKLREGKYLALHPKKIGNQDACERKCLQITSEQNYDWVTIIDADEFYWFSNGTKNVHKFLQDNAIKQNLNYLSFGKWMYDSFHTIEANSSLYDLTKYPFTTKSFCMGSGRKPKGHPICPRFKGRCKLLLKPKRYTNMRIKAHGMIRPKLHKGQKQFHTSIAHIKEWPGLWGMQSSFQKQMKQQPIVRQRHDFLINNYSDISVHNLNIAFPRYPNGTYHVYYDNELEHWMNSIVNTRQSDIFH